MMQIEGPDRRMQWVGRCLALELSFGSALVVNLGFRVRASKFWKEVRQSKARREPRALGYQAACWNRSLGQGLRTLPLN